MPHKDKEARAEYARRYYQENKEQILANSKKPHRVQKRKEYLQNYSLVRKQQIAESKAEYYKSNKQQIAEKVKERSQANLNLINQIKCHYGCMNHDCKWAGPFDPSMLDFHHHDPRSKKSDVPSMRNYSKAAIAKEINKCALLCANCHRLVHAGLLSIFETCKVDSNLVILE